MSYEHPAPEGLGMLRWHLLHGLCSPMFPALHRSSYPIDDHPHLCVVVSMIPLPLSV